jgi:hypothetical protein
MHRSPRPDPDGLSTKAERQLAADFVVNAMNTGVNHQAAATIARAAVTRNRRWAPGGARRPSRAMTATAAPRTPSQMTAADAPADRRRSNRLQTRSHVHRPGNTIQARPRPLTALLLSTVVASGCAASTAAAGTPTATAPSASVVAAAIARSAPEVLGLGTTSAARHDADSALLAKTSGTALDVPTDANVAAKMSMPGAFRVEITVGGEHASAAKRVDASTVMYRGTAVQASTALQATADGGIRYMTIISGPNAPSDYRFDIGVNTPMKILVAKTGAVALVKATQEDALIALLAPGWAKDANGRSLPVSYSLDGSTLVMHVDHHAAAYPVVADPDFIHANTSNKAAYAKAAFGFTAVGPGGLAAATTAAASASARVALAAPAVLTAVIDSARAALASAAPSTAVVAAAIARSAPEVLTLGTTSPVRHDADSVMLAKTSDTAVDVPKDASFAAKMSTPGAPRVEITMGGGENASAAKKVDASTYMYRGTAVQASTALQATADGGIRYMTIMSGPDAPSDYRFNIGVNAAMRIGVSNTGAVAFVKASQGSFGLNSLIALLAPPWAKDATGRSLPVSYTLDGSTLVMHVDHHDAAYPVVADPNFIDANKTNRDAFDQASPGFFKPGPGVLATAVSGAVAGGLEGILVSVNGDRGNSGSGAGSEASTHASGPVADEAPSTEAIFTYFYPGEIQPRGPEADKLAETMLFEVNKASRALDFIPRPELKPPGVGWLASQAVKAAWRALKRDMMREQNNYVVAKKQVASNFRTPFNDLRLTSSTGGGGGGGGESVSSRGQGGPSLDGYKVVTDLTLPRVGTVTVGPGVSTDGEVIIPGFILTDPPEPTSNDGYYGGDIGSGGSSDGGSSSDRGNLSDGGGFDSGSFDDGGVGGGDFGGGSFDGGSFGGGSFDGGSFGGGGGGLLHHMLA